MVAHYRGSSTCPGPQPSRDRDGFPQICEVEEPGTPTPVSEALGVDLAGDAEPLSKPLGCLNAPSVPEQNH